MNIRQQKGFSPLEAILTITVLILASIVGWLYFTNMNKDHSANNSVNTNEASSAGKESPESSINEQSVSDTAEKSKDKTTDWTVYRPKNKAYTIKLADGWTIRPKASVDNDGFYTIGSLALREGTPAKIIGPDTGPARGFDSCANETYFVFDYLDYTFPDKYRDPEAKALKTHSGTRIEKSVNEDKTIYRYVVLGNNEYIHATYQVCPGQPDYSNIVEMVIKSIKMD